MMDLKSIPELYKRTALNSFATCVLAMLSSGAIVMSFNNSNLESQNRIFETSKSVFSA